MAEERITEVETPTGGTHTHTTIVSDAPRGGGGTWIVILLLLIVLAGAGMWFLSGTRGSEVAKDNAIAEAADDVGNAATQAGNAAERAADKIAD